MKAFSPLTIRSITLKNRIAVSPMCQYSSTDGFANDWHLVHLGSYAAGSAGLIFTEATAVSPEGRISPQDLGIWKDAHIEFLRRICTFIESQGAMPGIQLAHAGRKGSQQSPWNGAKPILPNEKEGWQTLAPSALAFKEGDPVPAELSIAEIKNIVNAFAEAARRSLQAGFKVIELHGAHGYLINEFLSPASNKRTDEYGGSFENRIRFLLEIIKAVRTEWPETLPLFVRISSTDWADAQGGWTAADSVKLASILKENTVDLMDCSSGGNVNGVKIPVGPMYQTTFATQIKKETGILTGAVGMITKAEEVADIINNDKADIVLLARELLRDPYFPQRAAFELGADIQVPVQYERAKRK